MQTHLLPLQFTFVVYTSVVYSVLKLFLDSFSNVNI